MTDTIKIDGKGKELDLRNLTQDDLNKLNGDQLEQVRKAQAQMADQAPFTQNETVH